MAGHSKWANIRFRKGAQDAKRGKIFTKLIREITVAAKEGGDDIPNNPRLKDAITKAFKSNMKKDTVENAIKKGVGKLEGSNYFDITYEGYGPFGVAFYVSCLTDNKNRTVAEVRHCFTKNNGNLGADGSVNYLFDKAGQIVLENVTEDDIFDISMSNGAYEIETDEDNVIVYCKPEKFAALEEALKEFSIVNSEVSYFPNQTNKIDEEKQSQIIRLVDMLEDLDDIQNVYHNAILN